MTRGGERWPCAGEDVVRRAAGSSRVPPC